MTQHQAARTRTGDAAPPGSNRRWLALVAIAVAQLLTALDATVVNIALPSAQRELGFSDADRQWVITAYTLTFAGLLLLGGRIADRFGRKRVLLVALCGFAAASALAGAAPNLAVLTVGRALQGGFAAVLAPTALSLIAVIFTDQRERGKAFAVYGAVASSGAAVGLILGGLVTGYVEWRWSLYISVPIALAACLFGARFIRVPAMPAAAARIPVGQAVLVTGSLAALVYGCAQAAVTGWGSAVVVAWLAAGLVGGAGFLLWQGRAGNPMLPVFLLTDRSRLAAYAAVGSSVIGSFGVFLMLTYHFQEVLGYRPFQAGLAFLPMTAAVAACGYLVAGTLMPRVSARVLVPSGLLLAAAGLAVLSRLTPASHYLTVVLPAEILIGAGMGLVFTPSINVVTSGVAPRDSGVAAAVANTAMQVGGSLGVAVLNTIAVTATRGYLAAHQSPDLALVHGYATAAGSTAVLLAAVAVAGFAMIRPAAREPAAAT